MNTEQKSQGSTTQPEAMNISGHLLRGTDNDFTLAEQSRESRRYSHLQYPPTHEEEQIQRYSTCEPKKATKRNQSDWWCRTM
jgi:hypothetical protein